MVDIDDDINDDDRDDDDDVESERSRRIVDLNFKLNSIEIALTT